MKHKSRQQNKVADAFSKRATLLVTFINEATGFEWLKELYVENENFADDFLIQNGYLFKAIQLCML